MFTPHISKNTKITNKTTRSPMKVEPQPPLLLLPPVPAFVPVLVVVLVVALALVLVPALVVCAGSGSGLGWGLHLPQPEQNIVTALLSVPQEQRQVAGTDGCWGWGADACGCSLGRRLPQPEQNIALDSFSVPQEQVFMCVPPLLVAWDYLHIIAIMK